MKLKIDLHVHTVYSGDSSITLEKAIVAAKKAGLDGFAITDHDNVEMNKKILGKNFDLIIIPGVEVTSKDGHILGLGVLEPIKPNLSAFETVKKIHELGGLAIAPHPLNPFKHSLNKNVVEKIGVDAVETANASMPHILQFKVEELAEKLNVAKTGGSDAHIPSSIGKAYTIIEVEEKSLESILKAIKDKKTTPLKKETSINEFFPKIWLKIKRKMKEL